MSISDNTDLLCRLCGAARTEPYMWVRGQALLRCGECGFVQLKDKPPEEVLREIYGGAYFQHGKYANDLAVKKEQARRVKMLRRSGLADGARILDAGCATGDFVATASARYGVWGMDISPEAIKTAGKLYPQLTDRFKVCPLESPPFAPGRFDAVVLWDVVEHLWDPLVAFRSILSLLKRPGLVLLSSPDIGSLAARIMGRNWALMTPPEHMCFFNRSTTRKLIESTGGTLRWYVRHCKWANIGFLAYKIRRIVPALPSCVVEHIGRTILGRQCIVVPTGDVFYAAAVYGDAQNTDYSAERGASDRG